MTIYDDDLCLYDKDNLDISWIKKYPELKALALIASSPRTTEDVANQYKKAYEDMVDVIQTQNPDIQVFFVWE